MGLNRFPLLGISQGGAVAAAYAARNPNKVSGLMIYGGYLRGRRLRDLNPKEAEETEILIQLIRMGWGSENPAFRQVFTTLFLPDADLDQVNSLNHILLETEPAWQVFIDALLSFALERDTPPQEDIFAGLTFREKEVIDLVARGLPNDEIADQLFINPKTVRNHITNIFGKLNIKNRPQAIVMARDRGFGR